MPGFLEKSESSTVHFLHIGKTGGSAIRFALEPHLETPSYHLVLHGHETALSDIPVGEHVVFFLRDPISRFISGFYSRKRKGQPRYYSEWSAQEKEVFEVFKTPNQVACALADETSSQHSLSVEAMGAVEHFAPFRSWYGDLEYFQARIDDVLFIGFQESLDVDFSELARVLGVPATATLPTDDVTAHRNPLGLDRSIEERGILALKRWYAEDFRFVALCREVISKRALSG